MRGYELPTRGAGAGWKHGYESPCGVMRYTSPLLNNKMVELRIPMRGCEVSKDFMSFIYNTVTNPHAGL